jgi:predicted outer membrane protein
MKTQLFTLTAIIAIAAQGLGATKTKKLRPHPTVPPTSPMIALPAVPQVREKPEGAGELFTTEISGRDLLFFYTVIESGELGAYLGDLAKTRAEADAIKAVGTALAATQHEENKQLVRLASLKGVSISPEPPPQQQKIGEELEKLAGSNFDKACMDKIIAVNQQTVSAYEGASSSADRDIKSFSEQMLPIAKEKLRLAEKMTGAGSKAAGALFRTGAKPKVATPSAATPNPAPANPTVATPKPAAATPVPATPAAATPKPGAATPAPAPSRK